MSHWIESIRENGVWILAGLVGRMMFHAREAQAGRRTFWGRELPFELMLAIGMGLVGYSACAWFELNGPISAGVISAIAYLGPRAIDTAWDRLSTTLFSSKGKGA